MNREFFKRDKQDIIQKNIISTKFTNSDDVLRPEIELSFEEEVRKGEVDVVTMEDINQNFGGNFFKGQDIDKFEDELEGLIKKGQDHFLTQDEWEYLEKGRADVDSLLKKAVIVPKGKTQVYKRIYVNKVVSE